MKNQIQLELRKAEIEFLLELPDILDQDRTSLKKELASLSLNHTLVDCNVVASASNRIINLMEVLENGNFRR